MSYIPKFIRYNTDLSPLSKVLYAEIVDCMDVEGVCTKNNIYFSKILGYSKSTISSSLTQLREHGYISVYMEREEVTQKFIKRYIMLRATSNILKGGRYDFLIPYTEKLGGVEDDLNNSSDGEDAKAMSNFSEHIIINNNIRYIYTSKKASNKLDMAITPKQRDYLFNIVNEFYTAKRTQFPQLIDKDWESDEALINDSINILYKLIKTDNWDERVVRDVIRWATHDSFWRGNLLSLRTLRTKSANGQTKFANLYVKYDAK